MINQSRFLLGIAGVAVLCTAAGAQNGTVVKPFRKLTAPPPVMDSTFDFMPQINPGYTLRPVRPPHDEGFMPPVLERNSLPIGGNTTIPNITPESKFPAIDATGWTPPDPDIAVGPTHVLVVVNSSIGIFEKGGRKVFEQTSENFFRSIPGTTSFQFDPKAYYDPFSKRFFVLFLEQSDGARISKGLLAVSDDSNPTGNWFKYRIELKQTAGGAEYWLDYPGFGFNKDAVVITGNMFGFAGGYNGIQYAVIPKAPLLSGTAPTINYLSTAGGTAHPMRSFDNTVDRIYFGTVASTNQIRVGAITNLTATPQLTSVDVTVPSFGFPNASESANGRLLDAIGGRMMNCFFRGGRLVMAHTVQPNGGLPNAARWYEFNMSNWPTTGSVTVNQAGNVSGGTGEHFSMPAVTLNSKGDIAMVFARSSSQICMDFMSAGRKRTDPLNTMGAAKLLTTSPGSAYGGPGGNRFGDYFGAAVDPSDDTTFWGVGMVSRTDGNWLSVVNSFTITKPTGGTGGTVPAFAPTSVTMFQGSGSFGGVPEVTTSDNRYFTAGSAAQDRVGQVAAVDAAFTVNKAGSQFTSLALNAENAAATGVTTSVFFWNWTKGAYDYIGAFPSGTTDATKSISIPTGFTNYINSSRQVKVRMRAVSPIGASRSPIPFNYRLDLVQLKGE